MWKDIDAQVPRERLPSLADRPHMPFVEATILEVMRVRTVGPLALFHCTSCDTTVGGYFIPVDTVVSNSTDIVLSRHFFSFLFFVVTAKFFLF